MNRRSVCLRNRIPWLSQFLRMMKIALVFVFLSVSSLFASVNAQRVSIELKNVSLREIFEQVKKQTGMSFMYSNDDIRHLQKRDFKMTDADVVTIMEACLEAGVNYLDTANYEPKDEAHFEYSWQWAYHERFKEKGLTAILGCGFDPGVSAIFTAYAAKHHFDEIQYLDIVDCNAGNHGMAFATNFNPEINIREITQNGRFYENGQWVKTGPLEIHKTLTYPNIGERESYLLYHEELESLVKNFPTIKRARFWMTFGQEYLTHLRVIQNIGMARIDEVEFNGVKIVPLQFLKAVLPDPKSLGHNYHGETSIGCRIKGLKDGKEHTYYIYNNCDHEAAFKETGTQAVSYTTGVPAALGAAMFAKGLWKGAGVYNVEQFDPDPFLAELGEQGLPWVEKFDIDLEV